MTNNSEIDVKLYFNLFIRLRDYIELITKNFDKNERIQDSRGNTSYFSQWVAGFNDSLYFVTRNIYYHNNGEDWRIYKIKILGDISIQYIICDYETILTLTPENIYSKWIYEDTFPILIGISCPNSNVQKRITKDMHHIKGLKYTHLDLKLYCQWDVSDTDIYGQTKEITYNDPIIKNDLYQVKGLRGNYLDVFFKYE